MTIRAIVLVEPYGPADLTICKTTAEAVRLVGDYTDQGLTSRLVETTGTVHDLKPIRLALRADHAKSVAQRTQQVSA